MKAEIVNEVEEKTPQTIGVTSVVLAGLATIPFFFFLGLPAFILGIVGTAKKEGSLSIVGLVMSLITPWIGLGLFMGLMMV